MSRLQLSDSAPRDFTHVLMWFPPETFQALGADGEIAKAGGWSLFTRADFVENGAGVRAVSAAPGPLNEDPAKLSGDLGDFLKHPVRLDGPVDWDVFSPAVNHTVEVVYYFVSPERA